MVDAGNRAIDLYSLAARTPAGLVDYENFFARLADQSVRDLQVQIRATLTVAVAALYREEELLHLELISGNPVETPLVYDQATGELAEGNLGSNRWVAQRNLVTISPKRRLVTLERRRPGVSRINIEDFFEQVGERIGYPSATFNLTPVFEESFLHELDQFERIRIASISITQPNPSFKDTAGSAADIAAESGGQTAEVGVKAARGQSLRTDAGIVAGIRDAASTERSGIQEAKITGRRQGEDGESTLRLTKHAVRARISWLSGLMPQQVRQAIRDAAGELVRGRD
jgi:hypothetical protein